MNARLVLVGIGLVVGATPLAAQVVGLIEDRRDPSLLVQRWQRQERLGDNSIAYGRVTRPSGLSNHF